MAAVVELHPRALAQQRQRELTSAIGMMVALGSWTMMFGALFFVCLALRSQALAWPPPGLPAPPVALPAINTVVIFCSSMTLVRALGTLRRGQRGEATRSLAVTFALGVLFVALQVVLWRTLWLDGIRTSTGALGTVIYALTALHALHVALALLVLGYLLAQSACGAPMAARVGTLRALGMFWHFIGAMWLAIFVGLFLL